MRYMLLVYSPEQAWTPEEWAACVATSLGFCRALRARGRSPAAPPLQPVASATTVRVRHGETLITAGPFAETTEQLGGFFLIDVPDLDEAITVAARLPSAAKGTIEVRPVATMEGLPPERLPDGSAEGAPQARYMLLCYDDEAAWHGLGAEALQAAQREAVALARHLDDRRQYLSASPLHPIA